MSTQNQRKNNKFHLYETYISNMPWTSRLTIESLSSPDELTQLILDSRNINNVEGFLSPSPINSEFVNNVSLLFGDQLQIATDTILGAIESNTAIVIHGDYDVDGVSATAILWEAVYNDLGYENIKPFIPHRVDHGYGLSEESISDIEKQLSDRGEKPGVLISVDCGITGKDATEYAKQKGFTVIITDHHTRPDNDTDLPQATAVLHSYKLCGAGVSWVMASALRKRHFELSNPNSLVDETIFLEGVDLVALATLADVQELTDFNRSLVTEGLKQLTSTNRAGLLALYQLSDIVGKEIGPFEVGWVIAPRINASGRLDHALDALRLLVVQNNTQARQLAMRLNDLNIKRQKFTKDAVEEAIEMVEANWNKTSPILVYSDHWHEGVIGLIAGKLTQIYKTPTLALTIVDGEAKGSARSVQGINIVDLLKRFEDLFTNMGGHAQAAGCSLHAHDVEILVENMSGIDLTQEYNMDEIQHVVADCEIPLSLVTLEQYEALRKLEPFGMGNLQPTFISKNVPLTEVRAVGKTETHLKLRFDSLNGIGFGLAVDNADLLEGDMVDVLYTIDKNEYNGRTSVQVKVDAIQKTGS